MKTGSYLPEQQLFPIMGLDTLNPPDMLRGGYSPNLNNVQVTKGELSKRKGYLLVGDGSVVLDGKVVGLVEFETMAGVKHLVALTTTKQYRFDASSHAWVNITYQTGTPGLDVNWTGGESDVIDWCIARGLDGSSNAVKWLIVTNGKDPPRYWDGSMGKFGLYTAVCNIPSLQTFRAIEYNFGHLLLGNVTAATVDRQLIWWSTAGSLTNFTTGTSGQYIITDAQGPIQRLLNLSDRVMIYSDNSLGALNYVGGELIFSAEQIVHQTRLVSSRSIVNVGPYHLFLSAENFYLFDGNRLIRPIGDLVHRKYRESLFVNRKYSAFGFLDLAKNQVYFNVPTGASTSDIYVIEYDVYDAENLRWSVHQYTDPVYCFGFFSRDVTLTYSSPQLHRLPYLACHFTYNQASIRSGFPVRVVGSDGAVFQHDDTSATDGGQTYEAFWDSQDFVVPQAMESFYGRWLEIELLLHGFEVNVLISDDGGQTYTEITRLDLTSNYKLYKVPIDIVSRTFRVRLKNSCPNSNFFLKWLRVWVRPGGAH